MSTDQFTLSPDQEAAIEAIEVWAEDSDRRQFVLAGLAGTGKTTVSARFERSTLHPVVIGTPTGKAAQVLRSKGSKAETIHKLAYQFRGQSEDGDLLFDYQGLSYADQEVILLIDEASMVNSRIYEDLSRSGYKILFVGDHGQLPPVGGDPGIMRRPDAALEQVHRHDNLLLEFAHAVRADKRRLPSGDEVQLCRQGTSDYYEAEQEADVIVCLKNATRHNINRARLFDLIGDEPEDDIDLFHAAVGHEIPVICVQNNYRLQIFNGQAMKLRVTNAQDAEFGYVVGDLNVDGQVKSNVLVNTGAFLSNPGDLKHDDSMAQLDFGWALTCHKAQGSEFDHVLVIDETWPSFDSRVRWRYTAATRARKKLTWAK